jgi:hypothetical protein
VAVFLRVPRAAKLVVKLAVKLAVKLVVKLVVKQVDRRVAVFLRVPRAALSVQAAVPRAFQMPGAPPARLQRRRH